VRNHDTLNGFVDTGCRLKGELEFENAFRVDGRVNGIIRSDAELIIGEKGAVEGEIHVATCLIGGTVRGTVHAAKSVTLHGTAKVWADIHAPAVIMEEGAFLEGRVTMERDTKKAPAPPGKGAQS